MTGFTAGIATYIFSTQIKVRIHACLGGRSNWPLKGQDTGCLLACMFDVDQGLVSLSHRTFSAWAFPATCRRM